MKVYILRDGVLKSLAVDQCASVERAVLCDRGSADQITVEEEMKSLRVVF